MPEVCCPLYQDISEQDSEENILAREGGIYGSLDKLHRKEMNNLFSLLNIVTNKKSRSMN
jgi:hypothetical protein